MVCLAALPAAWILADIVKILFLNQQFQSPAGCSISRGYEFVRRLQSFGHDVQVICSGIETEDVLSCPPGQRSHKTVVDGVPCTSIAAGWGSPIAITKVHPYRRMLGFLNFARLAAKVGRQVPPPDVVFSTSPPLPIGLAGRRLAQFFRVPHVFEVRDPWPQALIDLGALKNPVGIAWMRWVERRIYDSASHFIALSPGIEQAIHAQGIPIDRITVVPNASDLELFQSGKASIGRDFLGLNSDEFACIYFGAMGMANGLDYLLDAAHIVKQAGCDQIKFVMVGTGSRRKRLENRVRVESLSNVHIFDPVPRTDLPHLIAACSVCLTIIRPSTDNPTWSPNKLFDSLAAGKPVVANVKGWIAEMIQKHECGRVTDPQNPQSLADTLVTLSSNPSLRSKYADNARTLAETHYSRDELALKLETALVKVCDQGPTLCLEPAVDRNSL